MQQDAEPLPLTRALQGTTVSFETKAKEIIGLLFITI